MYDRCMMMYVLELSYVDMWWYSVYVIVIVEYCGWNCCCVAGLYSSEILRALVKLGSLSHYLRRVLYILGGAGFLNTSEPWMTVDVF